MKYVRLIKNSSIILEIAVPDDIEIIIASMPTLANEKKEIKLEEKPVPVKVEVKEEKEREEKVEDIVVEQVKEVREEVEDLLDTALSEIIQTTKEPVAAKEEAEPEEIIKEEIVKVEETARLAEDKDEKRTKTEEAKSLLAEILEFKVE